MHTFDLPRNYFFPTLYQIQHFNDISELSSLSLLLCKLYFPPLISFSGFSSRRLQKTAQFQQEKQTDVGVNQQLGHEKTITVKQLLLICMRCIYSIRQMDLLLRTHTLRIVSKIKNGNKRSPNAHLVIYNLAMLF